jgi:hypothetical protein
MATSWSRTAALHTFTGEDVARAFTQASEFADQYGLPDMHDNAMLNYLRAYFGINDR